MSNWLQFEISIKLGRWGFEVSRDDGFIPGTRVYLQRYSVGGGSSYPRWQWRIGWHRPVTMKQEEMPVLQFVGARIVPCEIVRDEPWPDVIGDR